MRSLLVALVLANLLAYGLAAGWLSLPEGLRPARPDAAQINPGLLRVLGPAPAAPQPAQAGEGTEETR